MDVLHIHTKAILDLDECLNNLKPYLDRMPDILGCATTIQFIHYFDQLKEFLEQNGKTVIIGDTNINKGQLLGCNTRTISSIDQKIDAIFYFGDGQFHPKGLSITSDKDIFCYDPFSFSFIKFENFDFELIKKKKTGAATKFFTGTNVGILVSTKPGQQHLARAEHFANYCKQIGKEPFILMSDTLDFNSLEDFSFMDVFVNTMCGRIGYDDSIKVFRPIINFDDLLEFLDDYQEKKAYNLISVRK